MQLGPKDYIVWYYFYKVQKQAKVRNILLKTLVIKQYFNIKLKIEINIKKSMVNKNIKNLNRGEIGLCSSISSHIEAWGKEKIFKLLN